MAFRQNRAWEEHRLRLEHLLLREVESGDYLTGDHIDWFRDILRSNTQYNPQSAFLVGALETVEPAPVPHIQILADRPLQDVREVGHWIVAYHDGTTLRIYDSLNSNHLTIHQQVILAMLFPTFSTDPVFMPVQQQGNYIDCGLFAIANATSLALGVDPSGQRYNVPQMRPHLADMYRTQQLQTFPTLDLDPSPGINISSTPPLSQYDLDFPSLPPPSQSSSDSNVPLSTIIGKAKKPTALNPIISSSQSSSDGIPLAVLAKKTKMSKDTKKLGRPSKTKRGRKGNLKNQKERLYKTNRKAVKIYSERHPDVHRKAVKRYDEKNPDVNRRAVKRYGEKNPEVNRGAVKRYDERNPDVHRGAVKRYDDRNPDVHRGAVKRYDDKNPDVHRGAVKRYDDKNPDVHRGAVKRYDDKNPDVHRGAVKRYDERNPDVHRGAVQRYTEEHPDVNRDSSRRYTDRHPEYLKNKNQNRHLSATLTTHEEELFTNKQTPAKLRKLGLIGEYSAENLKMIKPFNLKNINLLSPDVHLCQKCKAPLFIEEAKRKKWCCGEGNYIVPEFSPLQADFYDSPHFLKHPRAYNNVFAFSALGVSHGFQHPKQGISFLKIQGRTYHRVFDLAYNETLNTCGMYIDDGEERSRIAEGRSLNQVVVSAITEYLNAVNPYIRLLKQLSKETSDEAHLIFEATTRQSHGPVLGDAPRGTEVAAIISTDRERYNPRQIVIWKVGGRKPHTVDVFHPLYESLQYPLLYPHGTPGWHIGLLDNSGHKISQVKYYRRLVLSEPRFSNLGRLSEEWLVDMYCRVEEERLRYISRMQTRDSSSSMRSATLNELQETVTRVENTEVGRAVAEDETIQGEGGVVAGRVYLPNTFTGGPRYMKTKYLDGMSVVSKLGNPSYFLTITCNPKWPEILNSKPPGGKAPASIVARVFQLKLLELLRDIRSGAFFGQKVYMFHVIEFQKRGLPHAHICFRVEGGGPRTNVDIDKVVRADIPQPNEADGRLRELVLTQMLHGPCGTLHRTDLPCWDNKTKKCTKHFPKPHTEVTHIDDRGFVHYKRDSNNSAEVTIRRQNVTVNDSWIVPYNSALLLKYNCHINLEIASTRKIVKYLFKYITKGPDEARVTIIQGEDRLNEVESYVTKRYIGACDAAWHIFEFDMTGREPNVIQLPVHLEGQQSVTFHPGQETEAISKSSSSLLLYFNRPKTDEFENLTYSEFFEQYIVHSRKPASSKAIVIPHPDNVHFITKRQRGEMVARLFFVSPNRGEQFFLRVLLNRFPCRGYNDLKLRGGEDCTTFQAAARSLGLVNDELEYEFALEEASTFMTGKRLRKFFVLLLVAGARGCDLWNAFKDNLCEDLLELFPDNHDEAYSRGLIEISRSLRRHGSCLLDHGLPDVVDNSTELARECIQYSTVDLQSFVEQWVQKLSPSQHTVYEYVQQVTTPSCYSSKALFIDGPAGTGKTLLLNVLTASLRSQNHVVLCTASSGIAAQNHEGGMTAHSMFKLPLNIDDENVYWGITGGSQRAELVRAAKVIIFDEASMAHKNLIHIMERSLRDLMQHNDLFGGKIVIFAGDFRQIPPIVVDAKTPSDIVNASLRCSSIWPHIKHFHLTETQRARDDANYANFLLSVGDGQLPTVSFGEDSERCELIPLIDMQYVTDLLTLIRIVFPEQTMSDSDFCSTRALLSITNESVDQINSTILEALPGEEVHLLSVNYVSEEHADDVLLSAEALANVHAKGVPDHDLVLKPNTVCMIIRNLSFDDGLLNGTKVIVAEISPKLIKVRKPGERQLFGIPRITFTAPVDPKSPLMMYRRQFPLKLCYSMTVNKSQGQTIDFVGVDLRSDVFSHGQLYVALGRVRSIDSICVLVRPDRVRQGTAYAKNVVYSQLLQ